MDKKSTSRKLKPFEKWKGVTFDYSNVTTEDEKKTKDYQKAFKEAFASRNKRK
ncbi:hypothetical protein H5993_05930 [Lactobacillus alvi]|uniref:Uncharacterized protein n=1 Tax=Limosilactobacillus alvi TaxID=990412 RepID=A0ABS2EPF1_9LACO|nr:hypothetical protein [Limosilactobacillus alvi]MBM6754293.1 hypothetical protein [Limosilactobacillus alvi]